MAHAIRVVFMGSPGFALPALRALASDPAYEVVCVYTQPDRAAGRGQRPQPPPVKRLALELRLSVRQPATLRDPQEAEALRELRPDLSVIAAYGLILPPPILSVSRHGTLNIHASLLPRHRGAAPVPAAILAGDDETGVTIMLVDEGLDTGPLLASARTPITPEDTTGTLLDRLAVMGTELLMSVLPDWLRGAITPGPQDPSLATLTRPIRKEQARIDWNEHALVIWRKVRAFNPWPLAHTYLDDTALLQIHEAWPLPGGAVAEPGLVLPLAPEAREALGSRAARAGFAVATGEGLLVPLLVQRAGRRPVDAAAFARGQRGLPGSRLASAPTRVTA